MWLQSFGGRPIISAFMKDRSIGEKRLTSMPDRVTNTARRGPPRTPAPIVPTLTTDRSPHQINLAGGRGVANRPTVINCFAGDMTSSERW